MENLKITSISPDMEEDFIMSLSSYKDLLMHYYRDTITDGTFMLLTSKNNFSTFCKYASFTAYDNLFTHNQDYLFNVGIVLSSSFLLIGSIILFISIHKNLKKYENIISVYEHNNIKTFKKDVFINNIKTLIPIWIITIISYLPFLYLANYINKIVAFPTGKYTYYSTNYYDDLNIVIQINKFEPFIFIIIILITIIFCLFSIKITKVKKQINKTSLKKKY